MSESQYRQHQPTDGPAEPPDPTAGPPVPAGAQAGGSMSLEEELHDFFDNASLGLHWVNAEGIIVRANRAELEMLGYAPEEYIGRHITEFHADPDVIEDILARLARNETLCNQEARMRCKDGSIRHVLISSNVLWRDGKFVHTRCFTRDITDRKLAEKRLIAEHAVARVLAEASSLKQATPRLLEAVCQTTGWEWGAMWGVDAGQNVLRCVEVWHRPEVGVTAFEEDGSEFPLELAITRIGVEGPPTFTGHLRDITEQKKAEVERARLLEAERHAREQAEAANRMKDEFLSIVSHELRTPLNAILGWAQVLRPGNAPNRAGDPTAEDLRDGLEVIERNARAQAEIIEDLLDMSRIISGKVRLDVQRVELPAVIEAAIASIRPAADAKGIRIQQVLDPRTGPVSGDPSRLQQVVWNLLSNAVKFTPRGGKVQVLLERVNSHVEITVSDTGRGIEPESLPHVFERFWQAEGSTTRRQGGLGLGLSIVKQLVELHGGTVMAKSAGEEQGATFRVALPLMPIHADEHQSARQHPTTGDAPPLELDASALRSVKVLVVDDEPDARILIRRLLEMCGGEVTTADSAEDALAVLDQGKPFDVIVSDVGMPDKDGYELARILRSRPPERGGRTPAVALTAFARSEDRTRAMLAGFDMHVAKPVEPSELCAVVARLAGRNTATS